MHSAPVGLGLDRGHPDWAAPKVGAEIRVANVAHTDDFYDPINPPLVFEL